MARRIPTPEEQQQAAAAAWWAGPIGQANLARQRGDGFFQTEIPHQSIMAQDRWWTTIASPTKTRTTEHRPRTDLLSEIEAQGWKLEHVNFVWVQTGEITRDRQFMPGNSTAISGHTIGIYLFRAV